MERIQRLLAVVLSANILNVSAIHSAQAALTPTEEAGRLTELDAAITATDRRVAVRTPRSHASLLTMLVLMLMAQQAFDLRGPAPTH